ncbi:hypothetical protein TPHA_0N00530 [Tetrapisispora phaffii CBS 4417]|uniref:Uncharacterized protein n=1 Tax=Tetrapisispora phaffii (strain ATCC 24235 / CBS 4417 / NBRC 1672 / NRRL Y-8282 / UCD 70-5) TaxID=1071381 RepID=G8C105_TETPH|nr:hypothetical protein TPHA_0N00530 [Tetrapisispora phaffii CBS 4417]CCE65833.1 hypothetical protein TPHA_0N00530 [Tetrapisispora phaffii CBS 4417]
MSFDWLNNPGSNGADAGGITATASVTTGVNRTSNNFSNQNHFNGTPTNFATSGTSSNMGFGNLQNINKSDSQLSFQARPNTNNPYATQARVNTDNQGLEPDPSDSNALQLAGYQETQDDLQVPLSLSRSQLSNEEIRTYLRWYNYIIAKTHNKLVTIADVFNFMKNFNITAKLKDWVTHIFRTCKNSLNIGQFFALIRLISTSLLTKSLPRRVMIAKPAPIPSPRSILACTKEEVYEEVDVPEQEGVDFDSFTNLLLTGKSPNKRIRRRVLNSANKKVRFSGEVKYQDSAPTNDADESYFSSAYSNTEATSNSVPSGPLDLTLPMDQLLSQMAKRSQSNSALVSELPTEQQETEEEKAELADMQDSLSHFKQIQAPDSATLRSLQTLQQSQNVYGGNTNNGVPEQIPLQPLKPTATGSGNHLFRQEFNRVNSNPDINIDSSQQPLQPLKPTVTGSANYLMRSQYASSKPSQQYESQPQTISFGTGMPNDKVASNHTQNISSIASLTPTATGSANHLMKEHMTYSNSQDHILNVLGSPNNTGGMANNTLIDNVNDINSINNINNANNINSMNNMGNLNNPNNMGNYANINNMNTMNTVNSMNSIGNNSNLNAASNMLLNNNISPQVTSQQTGQFHMNSISPQHSAQATPPLSMLQPNSRPIQQMHMLQPQHSAQPQQQQHIQPQQHFQSNQPQQVISQMQQLRVPHTNTLQPHHSAPPQSNMYGNNMNMNQNQQAIGAQQTQILNGSTAVNNYFQSLLSHTPSPSINNSNVSGSNVSNNMNQSQPTRMDSNLVNLHNNNNNMYQYQQQPQSIIQNQSQPQMMQNARAPFQNQIPQFGIPQQQTSAPQRDILGDLQSLQNQVDKLKNAYGTR